MINRREIILGLSILPIIPYINTKYKTPFGFEPYEKLTNTGWEEYPFDEIKRGDIIRAPRRWNSVYKVENVFPGMGVDRPPAFSAKLMK